VTNKQFIPDWVTAPGDTIQDILDQHGWTVDDLTAWLACTPERAHGLMRGSVRINKEFARRLTKVLGAGTEQFWLNRDRQYVEDCERLGMKPGGAIPEKEFWRRAEKRYGPYEEPTKKPARKAKAAKKPARKRAT